MYALYYEGNLLGIITDASRFGSIEGICDILSPDGLPACSWSHLTPEMVEQIKAATASIPSNEPLSGFPAASQDEDEDEDEDEWEEEWEDDDYDDDDDDEWYEDEDDDDDEDDDEETSDDGE